MFSSTIIITSSLDILVKIKHWNQSATDTPSPVSMLIYNNSASSVSLVCNPSHNVISPIDRLNNSPSLNGYGIPFLWTSLRNFRHSLGLTLFQSQHICLFFMCSPNTVFLPMSSLTEAQSLYQTSFNLQALLLTCVFTSLQVTTLKVMDKPNTQIRHSSNISVYIITTSKTTGPNFYLLWSLPTIML